MASEGLSDGEVDNLTKRKYASLDNVEEKGKRKKFQGQPEEPLYLFARKSKRMRAPSIKLGHYPPIPPALEQSVLALEQGLRCDCYLRVKEGLIPAHSVLLLNARTIAAAFASPTQESTTMIFDMSAWNTELVLDVLELLYTNSMEHFKPLDQVTSFQLFELLVFLDHLQAPTLLLRIMVSALRTLDAIAQKNIRGIKLDPVVAKDNLGLFYNQEGKPDQTCWEIIFMVLWIVTEAKEVPAMDKKLADTCIELFCRGAFCKRKMTFDKIGTETGAYFCSLSYDSIFQVVDTCMRHCMDYDCAMLLYCVLLWTNFDSSRLAGGVELLKYLCYETVPVGLVDSMYTSKGKMYSDQSENVLAIRTHVKQAEDLQTAGEVHRFFSPLLPFSFYTPRPGEPTPSSFTNKPKPIFPKESDRKLFIFGVEVLMRWVNMAKSTGQKACYNDNHTCNG